MQYDGKLFLRKCHEFSCKGIAPTIKLGLVMILYFPPMQTLVLYNQPNIEFPASLGAKTHPRKK